ncbi:MAG: hypothetical protein AB7L09_26335 [Nitrospira sp.]
MRPLIVVCQDVYFGVRLSQLSQITMDVVGIATLGLQLNGDMFDAEVRSDPVLDQPE